MAILTRKKQLVVGTKSVPVQEFKVGKMVRIVSVRPNDGSKMQWRQRDNSVQLRIPYHGTLNIEFHPLEPVTVATYFPFPATK